MKRKLVKQGTATLMVSLPSKWIKENKLEKGSEVDVEENKGNLMISGKSKENKREMDMELSSSLESNLRTMITNTYRLGYDRIKIKFSSEIQFKILEKIIKTRLIGFEIVKKSKNECIVENVTEPSHDQFNNILNKLFDNLIDLLDVTEKRMKKQEVNEDYEEIEERIQKFDNFCRRVIYDNNQGIKDDKLMWTFLTLLVHAQREIYFINKIIDKKINIDPKVISFYNEVKENFDLIIKIYNEKDIKLHSKLNSNEREAVFKRGYDLLEKSNGKNTLILFHVISCIRRIHQAGSPLAGLII